MRLVLALTAMVALALEAAPASLRAAVVEAHAQYIDETGHVVRGSFLGFWQRNGGLAQFG